MMECDRSPTVICSASAWWMRPGWAGCCRFGGRDCGRSLTRRMGEASGGLTVLPLRVRGQRRRSDLHNHRHTVPPAKAQRSHATLAAGAAELVNKRGEDSSAGGADGVAEGDAAAAEIELGFGDA